MPATQAPAGAPTPTKGVFKRLLIGRAVASSRLEHTLLPKILALPVFSSDALSSVAYATEEILKVLLFASVAVYGMVMPIAIAIAILLGLVVISYRQTVRAYPSGGGAYIVSKENLGRGAGLTAAAALLVDYILTVSVSVAAGVFAVTSLLPELGSYRVVMSLAFVVFITLMNIRGVKESGTLFAIPTYAFILSIFAMMVFGLAQCFFGDGCPQAEPVLPLEGLKTVALPVSTFVILHAFSSGSTALTGVEAISNGVPAFRRPQARNAAKTLAIMGVISVSMFIGISYLASQAHPVVSDERSVVAQIAHAVFGGGFGFWAVQIFTAAILILAANTAYQDFPRLSSILARDHFMPRQFMNRGDRLVFSNGVVGLGAVAGALLVIFDANVEKLIQLYVVGVFTSFTLSQTGMVRHWLAERHRPNPAKGWQRSIVINAVGAVATFVVLIVIASTKFVHGAWMVIVAIPFIVLTFARIHRHYESVHAQLRRGVEVPNQLGRNHVVLLVTGFGPATAEALGYIRSFRPQDLHAVYVHERGPADDLQRRWAEFAPGAPELELIPGRRGGLLPAIRGYVRTIEREEHDFITVVIPETVKERMSLYVIRKRRLIRLKAGLLDEPNVVVTDAPVVSGTEDRVGIDGQPLIPQRTEAIVFISSVNDATTRAVNYALTLRAAETRAIHLALDPEGTGELLEEWAECGFTVPLEIVEAPFRDLTEPMLAEVRKTTRRPETLAAVVIPEFLLPTWRHELLHNQNALFVKRLFLYEPRVVLTSVPFVLNK